MQTNEMLERRFRVCAFVLRAGITHYPEIMHEFNISKPTAISDVRFISDYLIPLETEPGCAGYIKVLPHSYQNLIRLSKEDETILSGLINAVGREDMSTIIENKAAFIDSLNLMLSLAVTPSKLREIGIL